MKKWCKMRHMIEFLYKMFWKLGGKIMKKLVSVLLAVACVLSLVACGGAETKKIASLDDLEGAKIGVQLGTIGDIYATDDYGDENVERYNKGAEAVQALKQGKLMRLLLITNLQKHLLLRMRDLKFWKQHMQKNNMHTHLQKEAN